MLYLLEFVDNVKFRQGEEEDLAIVLQLRGLVFKVPVRQESYAAKLVHVNYFDPNAEVNIRIFIMILRIHELINITKKKWLFTSNEDISNSDIAFIALIQVSKNKILNQEKYEKYNSFKDKSLT